MKMILLLIMALAAGARTLDQDFARRLTRTRSVHEIEKLRRDFESLRIARAACRLQLRDLTLPTACYESLHLETAWGLHPRSTERQNLRRKLDEICARISTDLKVHRDPGRDAFLSSECRKRVNEARAVLIYKERRPRWSGS